MPLRKPKQLTAENYREEIPELLVSVRRLGTDRGSAASSAYLLEGIATLCWQFGDPEAPKWFRQALDLYRSSNSDPSINRALLLWKMGEGAAFREECEKVLAFNLQRLEDAKAGRLELPAHILATLEGEERLVQAQRMAQHNVTYARFLLGDHQGALREVDAWLAETTAEVEKAPYLASALRSPTALRAVFKGILEKDPTSFREGLGALRGEFRQWPSGDPSIMHDLYRFSLQLGRKHFPDVVAAVEPFGNGQGRGAEIY